MSANLTRFLYLIAFSSFTCALGVYRIRQPERDLIMDETCTRTGTAEDLSS